MGVSDIFTALAEDRPYRKGMAKEKIMQILKDFSDRQLLSARIVDLLFDNIDEISLHVAEKQAAAREFYEKQFALAAPASTTPATARMRPSVRIFSPLSPLG